VLSLAIQESPLLLVPSTTYVDVEEEAPGDPFALASCSVSNVFAGDGEMALSHRVKLKGNITLSGGRSFVMQDGSVGVRVESVEHQELPLGQPVEVVGFPTMNGSTHTLTSALVRPIGAVSPVAPHKLDAGDGISFRHSGSLVQVSANLIAQRKKSGRQLLELQENQRVFEAELPFDRPELPPFAPGSRLQVSGVADFVATPGMPSGVAAESPSTGALKIWLRDPADVVLLSGPPWWSWKYTALLVGSLLLVVALSLLRIQWLRRRLERHLELSRQILESQESERHRIAANLHDSLGQNLLVIKNQARLAMQPAEDSVRRHRLDEISECASEAIAEVREITYALRPYQLDRLGLSQTIRATVNRAAENSSILFASHADNVDGVFDKESEIHVYRIVQEAVNNILKHSGATEAAVVVKKLAATVSLSVRDNGRGFDAVAVQHSESPDVGHGLSGIKERTRILGGTFAMDTRVGQGATLSIEIPIVVSNHAA
jgi:signal transduction histidine kinase